jgi:hypothetical protein
MTDITKRIGDRFEQWEREAAEREAKEALVKDFQAIDRLAFGRMPDKDLALWHAKYPADSPQARLAEHEWMRRLTAEQVRATRWATFVGFVGVIVGAVITTVLTAVTSQPKPQVHEAENKAGGAGPKADAQQPVRNPEGPAVRPQHVDQHPKAPKAQQ